MSSKWLAVIYSSNLRCSYALCVAAAGWLRPRYNAWAAIQKRARRRVFSPPSEVTPGERPASQFTWIEHAQQMADHESPRTTKLYDRTKDEITLSQVERIRL